MDTTLDITDNKIIWKKRLFYGVLIFVGLYLACGFYGIATNQIVDTDSLKRFYDFPAFIIILLVISFFLVFLLVYLGRSIGVKANEKLSKAMKLILIGFLYFGSILFFYVSGIGILEIVNAEYGPQKDLIIKGVVINNHWETGSRNSISYFMVINDSLQNKIYHLEVDRQMYLNNHLGSKFIQTFKIGSLGLIYKHDDR